MISKNLILSKLDPFTNIKKIVSLDQTVGDIIEGILDTHNLYKKEYDKISELFLGENEVLTGKNIFNFLKSNVPYYIESNEHQTLRSPAAIIAIPADCKSYSLFINGILDSLNRKGILNVPISYRFAAYKNKKEFQHVFAVMFPNSNKEIWIDPVLQKFNEKRQPSFFKDKKLPMALIALSGTDFSTNDQRAEISNYRDKLIRDRDILLNSGKITYGSSRELMYKVAINKATVALQDLPSDASMGVIDWNTIFDTVVKTAPAIVQAARPINQQQQYQQQQQYEQQQQQQQQQQTGFSTQNILLIGGAAVAAYFLFIKK